MPGRWDRADAQSGMTRDITPRCLETWLRDVLNQHTAPATKCDVSGHRHSPDLRFVGPGYLFCGGWSGWSAGGLVVAAGVDGELAEQFSGGGVDDADLEVLDEQDDAGSGVGSADADVAQSTCDAKRDGAGLADLVVADAVVCVVGPVGAGGGLGSGVVGRGRGGPVSTRPMGTVLVVLDGEDVEECLQLADGLWLVCLGA